MKKSGFTLIELLIVVAIIGILAAIAIPNFLEAQTRAKVSRVKSDLRTIAMALETYHVDYGSYQPINRVQFADPILVGVFGVWWLRVNWSNGLSNIWVILFI